MKNFKELPAGIKRALEVSMRNEIESFPGEDGIISERLANKLIQFGIFDHQNVSFNEVRALIA